MKKSFLFAAMAAVVLSSCYKSEVVEVNNNGPKEISFKAVSNVATKAEYKPEFDGKHLEGSTLTSDYGIYASATQKTVDGIVENGVYFNEKLFSPVLEETPSETIAIEADVLWKTNPTIYWPIGGAKVDYFAYALPTDIHDNTDFTKFLEDDDQIEPVDSDLQIKYAGLKTDEDGYIQAESDVASEVSFTWNTYNNQIDLLYACNNDATVATNAGENKSVGLEFKHAQALLVFRASINVKDVFKINSITFGSDEENKRLLTEGTFTVDNTRNNLVASWNASESYADAPTNTILNNTLQAGADADADYLGEELDEDALWPNFVQVGSSLLIPQQPRLNFTINYTLGDNTMNLEYNDLHGTWQMGKKYIYDLNITLNEIVITETVEDWGNNYANNQDNTETDDDKNIDLQ